MSNYADDNTLNACDMSLENRLKRLEHDSFLAIEWFQNNYMKLNEDKCHLLISGFKHEVLWADTGGKRIWENTENKLLGLHIDRDLKFTSHVSKICTTVGQKLTFYILLYIYILSNLRYMDFRKKNLIL